MNVNVLTQIYISMSNFRKNAQKTTENQGTALWTPPGLRNSFQSPLNALNRESLKFENDPR